MGCVATVCVTERCDNCGIVEIRNFALGPVTDLPRPFLVPFADWIWTSAGHTYCPPCWEKMRTGAKERVVKRTFRQWVKFLWTRKVWVAWIRMKEWVRRRIS